MTRTRLALIALTAAGAAALTSGCAAGGGAATLQVRPNTVSGQANDILAQDVVVVVDPETGAAQLTGTVINTGTSLDQLTSVTIAGKQVPLKAGAVGISGKSALNLASDKGPKFVVASQSGVTPGLNARVDLTFATGGSLTLSAQTARNTGEFAQYQPSIGANAS